MGRDFIDKVTGRLDELRKAFVNQLVKNSGDVRGDKLRGLIEGMDKASEILIEEFAAFNKAEAA